MGALDSSKRGGTPCPIRHAWVRPCSAGGLPSGEPSGRFPRSPSRRRRRPSPTPRAAHGAHRLRRGVRRPTDRAGHLSARSSPGFDAKLAADLHGRAQPGRLRQRRAGCRGGRASDAGLRLLEPPTLRSPARGRLPRDARPRVADELAVAFRGYRGDRTFLLADVAPSVPTRRQSGGRDLPSRRRAGQCVGRVDVSYDRQCDGQPPSALSPTASQPTVGRCGS